MSAFLDVSTELLQRGCQVRFRAGGRSMYPTILDGEAITVEPVATLEIRVGDVVLYRAERGVIAHRVTSIEKREGRQPVFVTRGDSAGSAEERIEARQILGKVVAVEQKNRRINLESGREKLKYLIRISMFHLKRRIAPFGCIASRFEFVRGHGNVD